MSSLSRCVCQYDQYATAKTGGEFILAAGLLVDDIRDLYDLVKAGEGEYMLLSESSLIEKYSLESIHVSVFLVKKWENTLNNSMDEIIWQCEFKTFWKFKTSWRRVIDKDVSFEAGHNYLNDIDEYRPRGQVLGANQQ